MREQLPPTVRVGDIIVPDRNGGYRTLSRWSPRYWWHRVHVVAADALSWLGGLKLNWEGFKVGVAHGRVSPGCGFHPDRGFSLRFDDVRGRHWYCHACQRPV